ncbi:helix-turn-helix transcriptional regulator [Microbacterium jejuense]|uniref:Helix-turn-helix transcriptional regulator n=1 Tax=Microbacterium jejuense TaxID=1263637 RepID=A0ABS7HRL7_9MICO|nr:LuxR C-terminal-related transcriptional regulator [Microbacterium jejuense]MBW9094857.1 helix-turn-helix transcriptional regulator [Microbacterium jejuense]
MPSDVISRPRLLELLDAGAPLTVVRGACGAGKTVVLREWVQHTDQNVLWITADPAAADSAGLARTIARRLHRMPSDRAPEDRGPEHPMADTGEGWRALRDALAEAAAPLTIVVDDAATLHRDALVELCEAVAAVASLRVIAAANRRTVLDGDGVALLVDRSVIAPMQLMFDEDEIRRALDVDAHAAHEILAVTNGFPAIIHALSRRAVRGDEDAMLRSAVEAVEEYMRIRVNRSGYDPALISALVRISAADAVDAALARELSGDARAVHYLDDAETYGFGAWAGEGSERIFAFAPFALLLLRRELERRFPRDAPALRRAVVDWSLRSGRPVDALRIAVDVDDLVLARHVVTASWFQLLEHGREIRRILGGLPLSRLRDEPLLVMILAVCYNAVRARRVRGLQLFRVAISAANAPRTDVSTSDRLFIWVAESVALRMLGLHERAAGVAVRALRVLADTPEDEKEPYASQVPLLCAQLGISLYYGGNVRQAIECFGYGAAVAAAGELEHAISNLSMLSGIHALNGDLPEARHYAQLIREGEWGARYLDGYQGTFYRVAEAIIAVEESDGERAAEHAAAFAPHHATSEHWIAMATVEALVAVRRGQAALGAARLESLVALRGREGHSAGARRGLARARVLLELAQGRVAEAKSVLHRDGHEDRFETIVDRARVALVDGRPRDTLRILSQSRVRPTTSRLGASASALRLAALLRTGGAAAAGGEVHSLAAQLCDRGMRFPLATLPPADSRAVQDVLRDAAPCHIPAVESVLPETAGRPELTERELVVLRALASDQPLTAIAASLGVSPNTVKTQVRSIYRKLGAAGREEAIGLAAVHHLLADDRPH